MSLFGHHLHVEFFGYEFAPETPGEHFLAFGLTGLVVALTAYGTYALVRDVRRRFAASGRCQAVEG